MSTNSQPSTQPLNNQPYVPEEKITFASTIPSNAREINKPERVSGIRFSVIPNIKTFRHNNIVPPAAYNKHKKPRKSSLKPPYGGRRTHKRRTYRTHTYRKTRRYYRR